MKKRFSIYHFLIAVLIFSMFTPLTSVLAGKNNGNDDTENRTTGSLTIHKFEREPGVEDGEVGDGSANQTVPKDAEKLDDVVFTITQTHMLTIDSDGNELWAPVSDKPYTDTKTTVDGKVYFYDLPLGRYTVKEVSGPSHVNLNPDSYSVDIPMTNADGTGPLKYDVHIYPKNETIRGAVQLLKVDGETCPLVEPSSSDGSECDGLSGVKFNLYDAADDSLVKVNDQSEFITDSDGYIRISNLAYGDYYFTETATKSGYVIGDQRIEFSITNSGSFDENSEPSGEPKYLVTKNFSEPTVTKEVDQRAVNREEIVEYTIKVNLPGDIKDYENFIVTDDLHKNLEFVSEGPTPSGFTFNDNGQILTWTGTPEELNKGEVTFKFKAKVKDSAEANVGIDNVAKIDYTNKHDINGNKKTDPATVTPTAGSLTVIKQDGKNNETKLEGAHFELKDSSGKVVASGISGSNGVVNFGNDTNELDYGNYTLHETKAPNEYRLLTKPIDVVIGEGGNQQVTIYVDNYKSDWQLPKTGGIGTTLFTAIGTLLMGLAFYLYTRRRKETA